MNRMEEYLALMEEAEQEVPGLAATLERAYEKKRKRTAKWILRPAASLAACFAVFVLLVNFCAPVAYACAQVPVLRELAEAVTFSRSLTDAVENDYVQTMDLSQTKNDITAEVAYLIVDQKQVNVFYRLHSDKYSQLAADPDVTCEDEDLGFSVGSSSYGEENGELLSFDIDFVQGDVPDTMQFKLRVYSNSVDGSQAPAESAEDRMFSGEVPDGPNYLAEFDFLLEFDPKFTASGKVFPVNQTGNLDGQAITVTDIEVYPTHMRVEIAESPDNTAWLKDLEFHIETDWGMRFDPVSSGITATGSADSPSMVSYRADSTYFYDANRLKLVITGAQWLRKDMQTTYVNLVTGETGELPEGAVFDSAEREGDNWIVTFRAKWDAGKPMYQLFGNTFYDAEGNAYEINMWSSMYGEADADGNITYFLDQFPLNNYPYEEVWLSPHFSHNWTAQDHIVIPVQ